MNFKKLICGLCAVVMGSSVVNFSSFAFKEQLKLDYMMSQNSDEEADDKKDNFGLELDSKNCDGKNCDDLKEDDLDDKKDLN